MGYLKDKVFYAIGAIDRTNDGGHGWRDDLIPELEKFGILTINPCRKPISVAVENDEERAERYRMVEEERYDELHEYMKKICHEDLGYCDQSDAAIAYIDLDVHMTGSYEEIFWLNRMKRPILIWTKQGKKKTPLWLFGRLPSEMIFGSKNELLDYLAEIDNSTPETRHRRWRPYSVWDVFKGLGK